MEQKTEIYQYAFYLKGMSFVKRYGFVNQKVLITKDNLNLIYSNQDKLILNPLWTNDCQKSYFHEQNLRIELKNGCIINNHRDLFLEIFEEDYENEFIYEYLDELLFDINKCPFSILLKLAELNYDIFNLIPNNLAINFYSLKTIVET